jgi:predicted metal-dependent HD superfamily phosphohydrolase
MSLLKDRFTELVLFYGNNELKAQDYRQIIEKKYSEKGRFYHTMDHINDMFLHVKENRSCIIDYDSVVFAVIWHDIIYNPLKKDNEERSAEFAEICLNDLNIPEFKIKKCCELILASKHHKQSNDNDTNFFNDADLVILGRDEEIYNSYAQNIRKEYKMIPKLIYNKGRKKVLENYLNMQRIYKTEYNYFKYERQARTNLRREIEVLK